MRRLAALFLMALAVPLLTASPVSALSCVEFLPSDERNFATIFAGRLVEISEHGPDDATLTYEVERTLKGELLPATAEITYVYGFVTDLTLGNQYYVGMGDTGQASICSTAPREPGADDVWTQYETDFLTAGGDGTPTADGVEHDEGSPWPWVIAGGGITLLAIAAAAAAARRGNY